MGRRNRTGLHRVDAKRQHSGHKQKKEPTLRDAVRPALERMEREEAERRQQSVSTPRPPNPDSTPRPSKPTAKPKPSDVMRGMPRFDWCTLCQQGHEPCGGKR